MFKYRFKNINIKIDIVLSTSQVLSPEKAEIILIVKSHCVDYTILLR